MAEGRGHRGKIERCWSKGTKLELRGRNKSRDVMDSRSIVNTLLPLDICYERQHVHPTCTKRYVRRYVN